MPDAVFVQARIDVVRIALRHVDVVEAEGRVGGVAEGGVGLVRIIPREGVSVEEDVRPLRLGEVEVSAEPVDEPVVARALGGQDPQVAGIEKAGALEIERARRVRAVDRRKPLRARQDRGQIRVGEVGVDMIVEVGLADRLAGQVLVRAHVDGGEPQLRLRLQHHPEMRIARRLGGLVRVNFAAQALVIDVGHRFPSISANESTSAGSRSTRQTT